MTHESQPIIEFRPVDRRKKESMFLLDFAENKTSQNGEDGIIAKIFEIIGAKNKWCIEFGAGNGVKFSNTFTLINDLGWSAILIEVSGSHKELEERYRKRDDVYTLRQRVGFEEGERLEDIIESIDREVPKDFDFISIDIDGNDYHIWDDLKRYAPRVVCIEFNHMMPNDVLFIQQRDQDVNIGSSCLAMIELGKSKGYELVAVSTANAIFVKSEDFAKFGIEDNSIDAMNYLGQRETKILQGYNGELFIAGLDYNPWKGFGLDHEMIQVLPKNLRKWRFGGGIFPQQKLK